MTLAGIIDEAVRAWLEQKSDGRDQNEEAERIRKAATATFGTFATSKVDRSSRVREIVSSKLRARKAG
jgi:hypothetical protein